LRRPFATAPRLTRSLSLSLSLSLDRYLLNAVARTAEQGSLNIAWAATADTSSVKGAYVSVQSIKE
jgi:hypothetical protein